WWPFALLVALAVGLMALAAVLESRRQYDAGNIPSSGERPNARPIRNVLSLHLTLQRGQTIGWTVGMFLGGLAFGSMTKSLLDAAKDNELLARVLAAQGNDGVYSTMTQFLAAAATAYVVTAVMRVWGDEQSGLGEAVLAGSVSRRRWLFTAVASALIGSTVLMFFAGLGNGLGAGLTLGEPGTIARLTLAGLAFVPAMAVIAGIAALAVAVKHPWIGWLAVTFVVTSLYLGALLRLPRWLIDLSPVGRTTAPANYPVVALAVMVVVAAAITALAGWIYRRRDAL
ncbi:MAG: polyether ionophore transport system permease protein, partial [Mycobacterium sp.]|nr:polyether ionophore transport system permease protein [Mycobacterium sp.]